jgi:hypothetical protein
MKTQHWLTKAGIFALLAIWSAVALVLYALRGSSGPSFTPSGNIGATDSSQVRNAYGQLPLSFEENRGQADEAVNFRARGVGYTIALSPAEAVFVLGHGADEPVPAVLRMRLVGANSRAAVEGVDELEGKVNYLIGNDPAQWRTNIPTVGRVRYTEVYPGIDLIYYGNQRRLEYDFAVAPGSDASAIALEFSGAESLEIEPGTGDLLVAVGPEKIRQKKPVSYQEIGGSRHEVESHYALRGDGRVGFEVGAYDPGATLIIDPVLVYSTFLGGNTDTGSAATGIAVDSSGNAYVVGGTGSTDFPTVNALQSTSKGGEEAFVTKLNATGSALVYSTYVGGSNGDLALDIAIDSAGNAYVVGRTSSTDFPTINAFQSTYGGISDDLGDGFGDAFVFKLNPAGSALIYSTYLGGSELDTGIDIAVDSAGNAYVTGYTTSTNFPTANAFQGTYGNPDSFGFGDAFVTKFNPAGSALVYSTYLGGNGGDSGRAVAVDSVGDVYVIGGTNSGNFPTTAGAFQSTNSGLGDAFVTKLNPAGSALIYSTFLGGSDREGHETYGLAIDSAGNAYVTGSTSSTNFPTANAFQGTLAGVRDIFVAKLNATGSGLIYSTYLGGSDFDYVAGIAVDPAGSACVTGYTSSANFPTANAFQNTFGGIVNAVVAKFNATGALAYSSYLGGNHVDYGGGIAVDAAGDAYVVGQTFSRCFPTTTGAFDTSFGNVSTGFITKISETAPAATLVPCPSLLLNISTRMHVGTDPNQLIGGFIITGSEPKKVIILATGPSLAAFGLQGVLADPVLELFQGNTSIASNDNWKIPAQTEIEATQLQPSHDLESALVRTLDPGTYTAIVRGTNGTGIGTVQVYDLAPLSLSKLANISSRGDVQPGDENAMIAGFIIGNGDEARVIVRALGPSLAAFGIAGIPDPTLELKNAQGATVLANDDWQQAAAAAEISSRGLTPGETLESALAITLPNGGYTAIVRGKGTASGVAVVEVYNVE